MQALPGRDISKPTKGTGFSRSLRPHGSSRAWSEQWKWRWWRLFWYRGMDRYSETDGYGNSKIWRQMRSGRKKWGVHQINVACAFVICLLKYLLTYLLTYLTAELLLFLSGFARVLQLLHQITCTNLVTGKTNHARTLTRLITCTVAKGATGNLSCLCQQHFFHSGIYHKPYLF